MRLLFALLLGGIAWRWLDRKRSGFYRVGMVDPVNLPPGRWTPVYGDIDQVIVPPGLGRAIRRLASAIQERP